MDFKTITTEDDEFIVGYIEGHGLKTVRSDHPNYKMVKNLLDLTPEELEAEGADNVAALFDPAEAISKRFENLTERVAVRNGQIYFDGDPLNNTLADLIVRLMEDDEDFYPFVLFLENLMQNPNEHSRQMAFDWIQQAGDGMAITPEGFVVGFKGVESDGDGGYQSTTAGHAIVNGIDYNGKIPYAVDDEVSMPRSEVTFDPGASCSSGLHVGTRRYARTYAYRGGCLMEVWINPRDIVSVPAREHEKMRVSRFYIAGTVEDEDVIGPLRGKPAPYVAGTEDESPYDEDEFGDGEEFTDDYEDEDDLEDDEDDSDSYDEPEDALDSDEEIEPDYGIGVGVDTEDEDPFIEPTSAPEIASEEVPAFVGRAAATPTDQEFAAMAVRAKRRHRGSPGTNAFRTYASTVGGWTLLDGQDGSIPAHWSVSA